MTSLKSKSNSLSAQANLFGPSEKSTSKIILFMRFLFLTGVVLGFFSWVWSGFSLLSNDHLVLNRTISSFNGISIKWSYSGIMDGGAIQGPPPQLNKSITGKPLNVAGRTYENGIGTFSPSKIIFDLKGNVKHFSCLVGVEGDIDDGRVTVFRIFADGNKIYESPPMARKMTPQPVDLDISGKRDLCLEVLPYNYHPFPDCADWLNIKFDGDQK